MTVSKFSDRLFDSMELLRRQERKVLSGQEVGRRIAAQLGRESLSSGWVSQLMAREEPPPVNVCLAIAKVCGVDPGWLAFGEDSAAPSPDQREKDSKPAPKLPESSPRRRL